MCLSNKTCALALNAWDAWYYPALVLGNTHTEADAAGTQGAVLGNTHIEADAAGVQGAVLGNTHIEASAG